MVGCRNYIKAYNVRTTSVSGIPMVGCRNYDNNVPVHTASVSGIPMVGCRNIGPYFPVMKMSVSGIPMVGCRNKSLKVDAPAALTAAYTPSIASRRDAVYQTILFSKLGSLIAPAQNPIDETTTVSQSLETGIGAGYDPGDNPGSWRYGPPDGMGAAMCGAFSNPDDCQNCCVGYEIAGFSSILFAAGICHSKSSVCIPCHIACGVVEAILIALTIVYFEEGKANCRKMYWESS